jgi:hypothetical protein
VVIKKQKTIPSFGEATPAIENTTTLTDAQIKMLVLKQENQQNRFHHY